MVEGAFSLNQGSRQGSDEDPEWELEISDHGVHVIKGENKTSLTLLPNIQLPHHFRNPTFCSPKQSARFISLSVKN